MAGDRRRNNPSCPETEIAALNLCGRPRLCLLAWTARMLSIGPLSSSKIMGWGEKNSIFVCSPKLGWGSYCRLCIHYCLPLVPLHQYDAEKIWYGGTFHWQSMFGWVDSVLIWDNGASHVWLAPLGHIGVSSTPRGYVNGPELHRGSGGFLCVCVLVHVCPCLDCF